MGESKARPKLRNSTTERGQDNLSFLGISRIATKNTLANFKFNFRFGARLKEDPSDNAEPGGQHATDNHNFHRFCEVLPSGSTERGEQ